LSVDAAVECGAAASPADGLLKGGNLDHDEACDQLLELGEGTVDNSLLPLRCNDARGFGGGAQPFASEEDSGVAHVLVILADGGEESFVGESTGLHVGVGFADDHEAHLVFSRDDFTCVTFVMASGWRKGILTKMLQS